SSSASREENQSSPLAFFAAMAKSLLSFAPNEISCYIGICHDENLSQTTFLSDWNPLPCRTCTRTLDERAVGLLRLHLHKSARGIPCVRRDDAVRIRDRGHPRVPVVHIHRRWMPPQRACGPRVA